jgi:hypothetical protein
LAKGAWVAPFKKVEDVLKKMVYAESLEGYEEA